MALKRSLLFLLISLCFNADVFACNLTEEDLVELRLYVISKCESNLIVTEELFGFPENETEIRGSSMLGGNLGAFVNSKIMGAIPPESQRNFSRYGTQGAKLFTASVAGPCTRVKFNKDLENLVAMEVPDQMESLKSTPMCRLAEKKLQEFQLTEFTGQCSGDSVVIYPAKKLEYRFKRTPASVRLDIRSKGDPTAFGPTQRPIKVDLKKNTIEWGLPFMGDDGNLLKLSSEQMASVENQINENLEEFVQMSDCCTHQNKTKAEEKICKKYNLKYEPQKKSSGSSNSSN